MEAKHYSFKVLRSGQSNLVTGLLFLLPCCLSWLPYFPGLYLGGVRKKLLSVVKHCGLRY